MAYKAIDIAEYIVNKCNEDKKSITHLSLQNLLYSVQKDFIKRGSLAFDDAIEARAFGPCVREVLNRFENYGIFEISERFQTPKITQEDRAHIDRVVDEKRNRSSWEVATEIFRPGGAWDQTFKTKGNEAVIDKSLIQTEVLGLKKSVEQEKRRPNQQKRLLVDMDGTLAKFHDQINYLERMYEKDFFRDLEPFENMVEGVRQFVQNNPDVEVFVVSAKVIGEPPYCVEEKNAWLDRYLPEIDREHRIFTDMGHSKAEYLPGGATKDDYLLDDYNRGLNLFLYDGGSAIKCHNNINQKGLGAFGGTTGRMWAGPMVHTDDKPEMIAAELAKHMGLEYDLEKVAEAYPEIKCCKGSPAQESGKILLFHDKNSSDPAFDVHPGEILALDWDTKQYTRFKDPFNAFRCLSGKSEFEEIWLHDREGNVLTPTELELNAITSNLSKKTFSFFRDQPHGYDETAIFKEVKQAMEEAKLPVIGRVNFLGPDGSVSMALDYYDLSEFKGKIADVEAHTKAYGKSESWHSVEWFVKPKDESLKEKTAEKKFSLDSLIGRAKNRTEGPDTYDFSGKGMER